MSARAPFIAPGRDEAARAAYLKASGGTIYYGVPGARFTSGTVTAPGTGYDLYTPWEIPAPILIDQLAAEVTTLQAATNFRMGIYPADVTWQPVGAPLVDSGDISAATTGVKTYAPGSPLYLPRGRYLSVYAVGGNTVALRKWSAAQAFHNTSLGASSLIDSLYVARAYAAFPTPGSAWSAITTSGSNSQGHSVFYRFSAA